MNIEMEAQEIKEKLERVLTELLLHDAPQFNLHGGDHRILAAVSEVLDAYNWLHEGYGRWVAHTEEVDMTDPIAVKALKQRQIQRIATPINIRWEPS
jgi:hypothetical protein